MQRLVENDGTIRFGLYEEPVETVNYPDYRLRTPMGMPLPRFLKKVVANQFVFLGVTGPDIILGMAVVDLKYAGNGFFYILDRESGEVLETKKLIWPQEGTQIAPSPERVDARFLTQPLGIRMEGGRMEGRGKGIFCDLELLPEEGWAPLRICTRAGYRGWVYTQKRAPIRLRGEVRYQGRRVDIASPDYMGLMDWTCGYMRRQTFWNWAAAAATLPDGRAFGMNLACGVNETSYTENAFWLDGRMTKVDMVDFRFRPGDVLGEWRITSNDGKIDLSFRPEGHRMESVNALLVASRFTQLMGTFQGRLVDADGATVEVAGCPGWTEDHYAKW